MKVNLATCLCLLPVLEERSRFSVFGNWKMSLIYFPKIRELRLDISFKSEVRKELILILEK